jgi:sulfur carrier protein ThiS
MHVHVKLFRTLPQYYPGHSPQSGLDVEISEDICVAELLDLVQVTQEQVAIVSINGRLANANNTIPDNAEVRLFQPLSGS